MANLAALFSYLVDVCTMKERTLRLSVAEGLISLSVGIASGGSGFVARHYSLTPVMIFMVVSQFVSLVFKVFFLEESEPRTAESIRGEELDGVLILFSIFTSH